jgi:hypothetical protein
VAASYFFMGLFQPYNQLILVVFMRPVFVYDGKPRSIAVPIFNDVVLSENTLKTSSTTFPKGSPFDFLLFNLLVLFFQGSKVLKCDGKTGFSDT